MGNIDDPRDRTNANLRGAVGKRAGQSTMQAEGEADQAIRALGGAGGQSGNGQLHPHHGFGDPTGRGALGEAADPQAILDEPENGPTYQTGGVGQDRAQHIAERKRREGGMGSTRGHGADGQGGGLDPPPGAPSGGRRV
jgi:hypothetical protein